jgi:hypothetical protein
MKLEILGAAVVAAVLAGAPGAFAFQFVNPDTSSNGTLNLTDPDQHSESLANRFNSGSSAGTSAGTLKFGNTTLQFGMSNGRDSNYGPSPAIQEKFLRSPASRTVPSQGW